MEKFAQHQRNHSGGKANVRVCGWRPCISRRAPAGKRPAGGLERSLRGAERTAIRSESGTSPLLAVVSEEKPVFRPGPTENKFQSNRRKRLTNSYVLQSGGGSVDR